MSEWKVRELIHPFFKMGWKQKNRGGGGSWLLVKSAVRIEQEEF